MGNHNRHEQVFYTNNNRMENLLKDTNTSSIVKKDSSLKIERNLNNILKKWLQNRYV